MATADIPSYEHVLDQASRLESADQLRLVENLALMLRQHMVTRRSITELRGLGKEVWQGIDAQEYVNQERDAWDG